MNDNNFTESITALKETIDRSNSLKWAFLLGMVRGIGAFIGATVVAGLLLGWAAGTFGHISEIPVIGPYFEDISETLEEPVTE